MTLKTFSAIPTDVPHTYGKFDWNPSTKYVLTDGRTTPSAGCWRRRRKVKSCNQRFAQEIFVKSRIGQTFEFRVPYSQRYLVLGLVGLALWLVLGINKYRCEYVTLDSMLAKESIKYVEFSEF